MGFVVYGIIDPRNEKPFYIGFSGDFEKRKDQHRKGGHGAVSVRLEELMCIGLAPRFVVFEDCRREGQARRAETFWVEVFLGRGVTLFNKECYEADGPVNAYKEWTAEDESRLQELFSEKKSLKEMAKELGRSPNAFCLGCGYWD